MAGQGIALATKGVICKPQQRINRIIYPLNVRVKDCPLKLNIQQLLVNKITIRDLSRKSLHMRVQDVKVNVNQNRVCLNLTKCEN